MANYAQLFNGCISGKCEKHQNTRPNITLPHKIWLDRAWTGSLFHDKLPKISRLYHARIDMAVEVCWALADNQLVIQKLCILLKIWVVSAQNFPFHKDVPIY